MAAGNRTSFAILGFLTMRPMSGYDIKKAVAASIDNFWSESFGQIYPALRRLAEDGLIEKQVAPSRGRRPRHVYRITDRGRQALARWLREPTEPPLLRVELLLKLFFGAHSDRATMRRQILAYRERMSRDLERYREIRERLQREHADAEGRPYWLLTLRFGELGRAAHIEWCDEAIAALEGIPQEASAGEPHPHGQADTHSRRGA